MKKVTLHQQWVRILLFFLSPLSKYRILIFLEKRSERISTPYDISFGSLDTEYWQSYGRKSKRSSASDIFVSLDRQYWGFWLFLDPILSAIVVLISSFNSHHKILFYFIELLKLLRNTFFYYLEIFLKKNKGS